MFERVFLLVGSGRVDDFGLKIFKNVPAVGLLSGTKIRKLRGACCGRTTMYNRFHGDRFHDGAFYEDKIYRKTGYHRKEK